MSSTAWVTAIYEAMVYLGINPHDIVPNYSSEEHEGNAAVAFPDEKVALSFQGNNSRPLKDEGWSVIHMNIADANAFASTWGSLKELRAELAMKQSAAAMIKTGSKEEQVLLKEIIRAGLPEPDRNFRIMRDNGQELTTPDFAWPDLKLAFFMVACRPR